LAEAGKVVWAAGRGGEASDRIAEPWGSRTPYRPGAPWPVRVDTFLAGGTTPDQVDRWVSSACVLCSNGCGLDIAVAGGQMVGVRGRAGDRVNHGRLGPKGRPCDYSGMSYDKLRDAGGIQWPCNDDHPDGTERLYTDLRFNTDPDLCEDYGHDLLTGAVNTETEYRASNPAGRALLHPARYLPAHEQPSEDFPLLYSTGRTLYQFHTRTKTGRAPQLDGAAPEAWVELSAADATRQGIGEGDLVRVESPRGRIEARARITGIVEGTVFAPFHYGYFDTTGAGPDGRPRAANELTITEWDPVSKQPNYKVCAVRVTKVAGEEA
jgi:anaerobic selenocysteine-containing dehydrogenase